MSIYVVKSNLRKYSIFPYKASDIAIKTFFSRLVDLLHAKVSGQSHKKTLLAFVMVEQNIQFSLSQRSRPKMLISATDYFYQKKEEKTKIICPKNPPFGNP